MVTDAPCPRATSPKLTSMQRLDPDAPVYALVQPDGSSITLDVSVPNALGDFSMALRLPDGRQQHASVYHTGEPRLFIAILGCWAYAATPSEIAAGIDWVRKELEETTKNRDATSDSENNFDYDLGRIATIGGGVDAGEASRHDAEGSSYIALTPHTAGLTLTAVGADQQPVDFWVAATDLPALVAGMIWRSFKGRSMSNSRLNTATYLEALGTFEQAVRARVTA